MALSSILLFGIAILLANNIEAQTNDEFAAFIAELARNRSSTPSPADSSGLEGSLTPQGVELTSYAHITFPVQATSENITSSCSGVIFHEQLILTNAHCIEEAFKHGKIKKFVIAKAKTDRPGYFVEKTVQWIEIHKLYYHDDEAYDLAIVAVTSPFSGTIKSVSFNEKNHLHPLSQWYNCKIEGSGQYRNPENHTCATDIGKRYKAGILLSKDACDETLRLAPEPHADQWPHGTCCFYNNVDSFCHEDDGAGIFCQSKHSLEHQLVGLGRAAHACCGHRNRAEPKGPTPMNMVILDRVKRDWIEETLNHFKLNKKLPSEGKPQIKPDSDYDD